MPRGKRRKGKGAKKPDYPSQRENHLDSGETIAPDKAPIDVDEVFADTDDDDPWGSQDPNSFFADPSKGPAAPDIPEPPGSQPQTAEYVPPRLKSVEFNQGYFKTDPVTEPNVQDDRRIHLTWVVNEVSVKTMDTNGQLSPEIVVKAMLCAAVYDMVPVADGERREPMLQIQPITKEPIELTLPSWLLPPKIAGAPDQISMAMAEKLLAQLYASFPTEIIRTPPKPAAMEKIPNWLLKKMQEQKGPQRP